LENLKILLVKNNCTENPAVRDIVFICLKSEILGLLKASTSIGKLATTETTRGVVIGTQM
jgi:hypothetical protein